MSCSYLAVACSPVRNVRVIEDFHGIERDLVNLSRKATDSRARRQLKESSHSVIFGQELNVDRLHCVVLAERYQVREIAAMGKLAELVMHRRSPLKYNTVEGSAATR